MDHGNGVTCSLAGSQSLTRHHPKTIPPRTILLATHGRTMNSKIRYRDYRLTAVSTLDLDGKYRSRVALTVARPGRPLSQRFIDFESFVTKEAADERAITAGKLWIDDQYRIASTAFPTEFDTLV
jgi:hypothetical protein